MHHVYELDKIALSVKSHRLLKKLLKENPRLEEILTNAKSDSQAREGVYKWAWEILCEHPESAKFYREGFSNDISLNELFWQSIAAIRVLDYVNNAGREFVDLNLHGFLAVSNPFKLLWLAVHTGTGGAKPFFFEDMLHLFRQLSGKDERKKITEEKLLHWMKRYPSGLDPRIIKLRKENRDRILNNIIDKIDEGEINDSKYFFDSGLSREQKFKVALQWWNESAFHLRFAIRTPDAFNEYLGFSLEPETMKILYDAEKAGIPFFINPYYLSLLQVKAPYFAIGADLAIRQYVIYSRQLVEEFGNINAWEKEDKVEPGKPNEAGWILPSHHNIHRRYPEVAILIPDTMGRACAGLCTSCQRMYDFQNGYLNFNLSKLKPDETWPEKLHRLLKYFEEDSQLRDLLITGGDALMSADKSLDTILNAVYDMAVRKMEANKKRRDGEKYAELLRIRLGTRLPVYLPQRITDNLIELLRNFKERATKIGMRKFIIQTHFESPMEVTPESEVAIKKLISAGWTITNQHVFTTASSRRGHNIKLRKVLNEIGVLPYYTFTVKGYMENSNNFATNARAVQEAMEEKTLGKIDEKYYERIRVFPDNAERMIDNIAELKADAKIPLLATDRNVLNLPGVGKSLTYRVIGITRYGRRILEFEHDATRSHSPIVEGMEKVIIIEPKSISEYLEQLNELGEDLSEYSGIYGYSIGQTEPRMPIFDYPEFDFKITDKFTNLKLPTKEKSNLKTE